MKTGLRGDRAMARTTARTLAGRTVAAAKRATQKAGGQKKSAAAKKATPAKKAPATKKAAPAKKTAAKKTPAKKATPAKKTPAKKTSAKRAASPAKQTPAKTSAAKKSTAKRSAAKKTPATGTSPRKLAVKADEKPWTAAELAEVRGDLNTDRSRLRSQLNLAEHELHDLMRDAGDGAGNDQADVGSSTFERDQEMTLANNAREMLAQTERALVRIEDGSYGVCESCGEPIGKMRLMAYPRATLCLPCKQREERR
jgi:RNA polymerase-binding protein DksA